VIIGGTDADTFVFNSLNAGEADRITDFEDGVDMIRLVGVTSAATGQQGFLDALTVTSAGGRTPL
jgi:Ca2+-binding RTX toxin-like protein